MGNTVDVRLDYLQAVQLIAACENREQILEAHLRAAPDTDREPIVQQALVDTIAAELSVRRAFGLARIVKAPASDDIPSALDGYWNRGA